MAFLESARFYLVRKAHPGHGRIVKQLKDAMAPGRLVNVRLASLDSDVIEDAAHG